MGSPWYGGRCRCHGGCATTTSVIGTGDMRQFIRPDVRDFGFLLDQLDPYPMTLPLDVDQQLYQSRRKTVIPHRRRIIPGVQQWHARCIFSPWPDGPAGKALDVLADPNERVLSSSRTAIHDRSQRSMVWASRRGCSAV